MTQEVIFHQISSFGSNSLSSFSSGKWSDQIERLLTFHPLNVGTINVRSKVVTVKCFFFHRPVRALFLLKFDETRMIL